MFNWCMKEHADSFSNPDNLQDSFVIVNSASQNKRVLLEVVGCTNVELEDSRQQCRLHCNVFLGNELMHATDVVNDNNPIWTIKTKSLCIVNIPDDLCGRQDDSTMSHASESEEEETKAKTCVETTSMNGIHESMEKTDIAASKRERNNTEKHLLVALCQGKQCLGKVRIPLQQLLDGNGNREEFELERTDDTNSKESTEENQATTSTALKVSSMLALRYRLATVEDADFLQRIENQQPNLSSRILRNSTITAAISSPTKTLSTQEEEGMDINFRFVEKKKFFSNSKKLDPMTGKSLCRLQPPKPSADGVAIEWMAKEEIQQEAYKPSQNWLETGHGEAGTLFLEIIGCDNLPNLDLDIPGSLTENITDPFVAIAVEDTMVRTRILFDTLCPRWMPWSTRAFAFNLQHPGSMIFLGVFDFDEELPVNDFHDPIGRVVINTINFESGMTYLLHYKLVDNSQMGKDRGTITLRIRIEWKDENEAAKLALSQPPPFVIHVDTKKSWHVLHYCTYGAVNMEKPSIASVKLYLSEAKQMWRHYCYALDIAAGILLWRGRATFPFGRFSVNVWFPIHSVWLFISVALAFEDPSLAPSIFFYGVAWIMVSLNHAFSRNPYPWYRVRKFESLVWVLFLGSTKPTNPLEASSDGMEMFQYDALVQLREDRMIAFISALLATGLKAYKIYSGTSESSWVETTEDPSWYFLSDKLYYPHMTLKYFCSYGRSLRNFIGWRSYASFPKTLNFLMLGTLFLVPPFRTLVWWIARLLIWSLFGPLMKVLDIVWVHKYYKTVEELMDDVAQGRQGQEYRFMPFFEAIVEHDFLASMRKSGRVVAEDAKKTRDMKEMLHGKWSETVPWVDNSRELSFPLPQSSAKPFESGEMTPDRLDWKFSPGRKVAGSMTMRPTKLTSSRNLRLRAKKED